MGLELFSLHNGVEALLPDDAPQVLSELGASASQMREANVRLGFGLLVVFFYLVIGAFVRTREAGFFLGVCASRVTSGEDRGGDLSRVPPGVDKALPCSRLLW